MSDTASNQDRVIVTEGTAHSARTFGATDICFDPASKKVRKFSNSIRSTKLKKDKTVHTKIAGKPIMVKPTQIGPQSSYAHSPYVISFCNGMQPYRGYAQATSWSPDVKAEGEWVVRTDDSTNQNIGPNKQANTVGRMDGLHLKGDETTVAEFQKLKCHLEKLEGTQAKRALGKRSEKATREDYLEILSGKTVEFESERLDMTNVETRVVDPACELVPEHTTWLATRTGAVAISREKKGSGKKFTLGSGFTGVADVFATPGESENPTERMELSNEQGVTERGNVRQRTTEALDKPSDVFSVDWAAVRSFLRFYWDPCLITVTATACNNNKSATLRVFPKGPLKCTITIGVETNDTTTISRTNKSEIANKIYDKFGKLKSLCSLLDRVLGCADVELEFVLFKGFQLEFAVEYKECTKTLTTKSGDWRSNNHVGLDRTLKLQAETLVKFGITIRISVIRLALTYVTGGAARAVAGIIEEIEEELGTGIFIKFWASLSVGLSLEYGIDEHEEDKGHSGKCTIQPEVGLELEVLLASAELRIGSKLTGKVELIAKEPDPGYYVKLESVGELEGTFYVEGKVKGRVLWVGPRYELGGRKEFELFKWELWKGDTNILELKRKTTT